MCVVTPPRTQGKPSQVKAVSSFGLIELHVGVIQVCFTCSVLNTSMALWSGQINYEHRVVLYYEYIRCAHTLKWRKQPGSKRDCSRKERRAMQMQSQGAYKAHSTEYGEYDEWVVSKLYSSQCEVMAHVTPTGRGCGCQGVKGERMILALGVVGWKGSAWKW